VFTGHPSEFPEENFTLLCEGKDLSSVTGNKDPLKDTEELIKLLESANDSEGPLKGVDSDKRPWFIFSNDVKYFWDNTCK